MTGKKLYGAINNIDDAFIQEADEVLILKKSAFTFKWKLVAKIAACIVLVVCASVTIPRFLLNSPSNKDVYPGQNTNAILNDYADIYYLENGSTSIKKESMKLDYTPQNIFQEWKKLNNIPDNVTLVNYKIDSNGYEQSGSSDTAKYVVGDVFTLNITLSNEFIACLTKSNRTALIKTLEKTLSYQKIKFKTINIFVDGQRING